MADTGEAATRPGESGVMNNNNNNQSETLIADVLDGSKIEDKTIQSNQAEERQPQSAGVQFQDITDRALHFLSHASHETIVGCLVGLSATTYFVLGRVGLLLIGLVGGVALHASWEAHSESDTAAANQKESKKRREISLELVQRLFTWKDERSISDGDDDEEQEIKPLTKKTLDFTAFRPETATALAAFSDAIIRDYVKYAPLFPLTVPLY